MPAHQVCHPKNSTPQRTWTPKKKLKENPNCVTCDYHYYNDVAFVKCFECDAKFCISPVKSDCGSILLNKKKNLVNPICYNCFFNYSDLYKEVKMDKFNYKIIKSTKQFMKKAEKNQLKNKLFNFHLSI